MGDEGARGGEDIYALLELCSAEELEPIVDTLTSTAVSFLKLTRAYERHHPDHPLYTDQIGDETCRLGTIALGKADGERPEYQAMIAALCKKIGILADSGKVGGADALLLNTLAGRNLACVAAADRPRLVAEAAAAASTAASGVFSSDAWPPLAAVLIHIAYLRRRLTDDGRLGPRSSALLTNAQISSGADHVAIPQGEVMSVRIQGDELVLGSVSDLPDEGWRSLGEAPKLSSALDPVLKGLQPLMAVYQMLHGEELLRRLPEGVKGTAHIVEAGTKGMKGLETVAISGLMGPMAIMVLASAVAEQRKLEAIEKSLAEIRSAIADVSRFQQEERRSVLKGSIRYFQQVASSVLAGELEPEVLQEIEGHEVDLVRVQEHLVQDLRTQISSLQAIKKDTFGGSSKFAKAIQEAQAGVDARYDEVLLCIRARACGYQLLSAFPGREAGKKARLADIQDALETFSPMGEATTSLDRALREKVKSLSSYEIKAQVLGRENKLFDRIAAAHAEMSAGLASARLVADTGAPIRVDLRIRDGQPMAVRLA